MLTKTYRFKTKDIINAILGLRKKELAVFLIKYGLTNEDFYMVREKLKTGNFKIIIRR